MPTRVSWLQRLKSVEVGTLQEWGETVDRIDTESAKHVYRVRLRKATGSNGNKTYKKRGHTHVLNEGINGVHMGYMLDIVSVDVRFRSLFSC